MQSNVAVRPLLRANSKKKNDHLGLRIMRRYMHAIRDGEKHYEYRSYTPYYERILGDEKRYRKVTFHYQREERLTCDVVSIKVIRRPAHVDRKILPTDKVYAIELRNPRTWYKTS